MMHATAALIIVVATTGVQQQGTSPRLYRLFQGSGELGRETYRRDGDTLDRSTIVPALDLRLDSRAVYDGAGRFLRFEARILNGSGDVLRGSYIVEASGDSLIATRVRGEQTQRRTIAARRADGVVPAQSLSVFAEAAERARGRDTVFAFLPMGGDTAIALAVHHGGDSIHVTTGGTTAVLLRSAGARSTIAIPAQQVVARVWDGRDSLAPLAGVTQPRPDYRAPPGAAYTAAEVRVPIRTAAGDTFSIAGTLTLPIEGRHPAPIVVTISGSGRQTRDEDLWPLLPGYRPFREIADRLGGVGVGVLRYDDRGTGGSGGGALEGTTADYAQEVAQIVAWLRSRSDVDPARIALLGHSEGGAIGPLVAADDSVIKAIVILAGPAKTGRAIVRDQIRRPIEVAAGLSTEERAYRLATVDRTVEEWSALNAWTRWLADYDPLPVARRLRQPVLILQGELDRQVTVGQADTLAAAIRAAGNRDVTVRTYPRLNHLFLPTDGDGSPADYPALPQRTLPPDLLDTIAHWLASRLR